MKCSSVEFDNDLCLNDSTKTYELFFISHDNRRARDPLKLKKLIF